MGYPVGYIALLLTTGRAFGLWSHSCGLACDDRKGGGISKQNYSNMLK
jgi:hypothetical protein